MAGGNRIMYWHDVRSVYWGAGTSLEGAGDDGGNSFSYLFL